jgi:hypothetical protein
MLDQRKGLFFDDVETLEIETDNSPDFGSGEETTVT